MVKSVFFIVALCISNLVNGQCANPRTRPEIRSMAPDQRARFIKALNLIRTNGDLERLSKLHVDNAEVIHGRPVFLAFHRVFVNEFASALDKADPGVTVPYWDWSLDATNPAASDLFTNDYLGGNGAGPQNCVQSGPFANWQLSVDSPHCLARKFNQGDNISPFWPPEALLSMQKTCMQYGALSSGIENGCHGAVHLGISGDMSTMFAPNDPFFFLHHLMVDKLWYDWQLMEPKTRFKLYDSTNYENQPVNANDLVPGFPNVHIRDILDPREGLCYVYVDSGSREATKRLMDEVDRQSNQRNSKAATSSASPSVSSSESSTSKSASPSESSATSDTSSATSSSSSPLSTSTASSTSSDATKSKSSTLPSRAPSDKTSQKQAPSSDNDAPALSEVAAAASAAGNGMLSSESAAQLNDLTKQVSRLSGDSDARAGASSALHNQQVNFLQNAILNGLGGNRPGSLASAIVGRHHRFLRRYADELVRRNPEETRGLGLGEILAGLASGLLGKEGVVGHLVQGLSNVVQVLPQGLGETLKAVGSIADNVISDVFNILNLPKIDMSKVPEKERRIPYVAQLPDWWYQKNNLNATCARQLQAQIHEMIDGLNKIPGYVSPAVAYYAAKKYGDAK
ncbi:hypothetical protein LPJ66_000121 [Kickxella alabastrina]|uniref:Uncharacterized protein n=1 Tax=Kickxella alabastrina TaxID=61397 RepID=A0ACC1IX00_9FUNG|nr:hypothetical protein LPJ66_000121 [Kickxella alabastrina]